jgi:hypothetical protein
MTAGTFRMQRELSAGLGIVEYNPATGRPVRENA